MKSEKNSRNVMNKEEILELIDERATELELQAYKEIEDFMNPAKGERLGEQAKALRNIQKEIRDNG